jgi:DNA modification methylase
VDYQDGRSPQPYEEWLRGFDDVWLGCARVLAPSGKLWINSAMMPVPQAIEPGEIRALKNTPDDIGRWIEEHTRLTFMDKIVWVKQTSKLIMWPRWPGNARTCNALEDIRIYRKSGKRPPVPDHMRGG